MRGKLVVGIVAVAGMLVAGTCVEAAKDPAAKCKQAKAKAAVIKAASLLKALGKNAAKNPDTKLAVNISKAQSKFTKAVMKAEDKGGCQTVGDSGDIEALTDVYVLDLLGALEGSSPSSTTTLTAPSTTLTVTTTTMTAPSTTITSTTTTTGVTVTTTTDPNFPDNGDGTITDLTTGLMWEKLSWDGSIHDVNNLYSFDPASSSIVQQRLAELNSSPPFAGYTDWRLPTVAELASIIDVSRFPYIRSVFDINCHSGCSVTECSCTHPSFYWSSTKVSGTVFPNVSYFGVDFSTGIPNDQAQAFGAPHNVRAVRPAVTTTTTSATTTTTLVRFVDSGDGTITDLARSQMWEKKDQAGGLHDIANQYTWAGLCSVGHADCQPNAAAATACSAQTGGALGCAECSSGTCDVDPYSHGAITTIWDWLVQVNGEGGSGFAGHSDWRIPSEDGCNACYDSPSDSCPCGPAELESILLEPYPCGTIPCIDGIFGPTAYGYWSSTTNAGYPFNAWLVHFDGGRVGSNGKGGYGYVRAVRGGP